MLLLNKLGIYKEQYNHCLQEFQNKSGLTSHQQQWCKAAIVARQKREMEESMEIESSHDTTVFVATVTKYSMLNSTATEGWRKYICGSRYDACQDRKKGYREEQHLFQ
jgi:hypothetical protein